MNRVKGISSLPCFVSWLIFLVHCLMRVSDLVLGCGELIGWFDWFDWLLDESFLIWLQGVVGCLIDWLVDWLIDWWIGIIPTDWLMDGLIKWHTDWFIYGSTGWLVETDLVPGCCELEAVQPLLTKHKIVFNLKIDKFVRFLNFFFQGSIKCYESRQICKISAFLLFKRAGNIRRPVLVRQTCQILTSFF